MRGHLLLLAMLLLLCLEMMLAIQRATRPSSSPHGHVLLWLRCCVCRYRHRILQCVRWRRHCGSEMLLIDIGVGRLRRCSTDKGLLKHLVILLLLLLMGTLLLHVWLKLLREGLGVGLEDLEAGLVLVGIRADGGGTVELWLLLWLLLLLFLWVLKQRQRCCSRRRSYGEEVVRWEALGVVGGSRESVSNRCCGHIQLFTIFWSGLHERRSRMK